MRKILVLSTALFLMLTMLIGCTEKTQENSNNVSTIQTDGSETNPSTTEDANNSETKPNTTEDAIVKLGLGHITSISKSKDLGVDKDEKEILPVGQVDTVIVAAAFNEAGKVVKVTIDNAQTKVNFDNTLKLTSDVNAENKTKIELGDEYGMISASKIQKNWYEQIAELEKWMIGKTVEEVKAMKVKKVDDNHPSVPDEPDLLSSVTITVQDYIGGLEEAYNNAIEVANGAEKLGLGHTISIKKSKSLDMDKDGNEILPLAQVDTTIAATLFDANGKVTRTIIDTAQTKVSFDKDGKVTTDKAGEFKTKVELGDEYGMINASKIEKNWYEQIAELEKWMSGKTVDEIKSMNVKKVDDNHPSVPDVPELTSHVTMDVGNYIMDVEESYQNAK